MAKSGAFSPTATPGTATVTGGNVEDGVGRDVVGDEFVLGEMVAEPGLQPVSDIKITVE